VVAGDSGAWDDPTADGIFAQLVTQIGELDPPPVFFANLGDFAGPGTIARHEHYLRLVEPLTIPNVCVVGNHDLDDESGWDAFARVHGPVNSRTGLQAPRGRVSRSTERAPRAPRLLRARARLRPP
jgi:hypothetical protein